MTRPICKFHTIVFSSVINPYFMLWVIFPIPDPAMSFKKIHVLIRLAHRHSFNEQINHSDGYNGVITGFKYDNLHPNGAASALALSKEDRLNWRGPLPTHPPTPTPGCHRRHRTCWQNTSIQKLIEKNATKSRTLAQLQSLRHWGRNIPSRLGGNHIFLVA